MPPEKATVELSIFAVPVDLEPLETPCRTRWLEKKRRILEPKEGLLVHRSEVDGEVGYEGE